MYVILFLRSGEPVTHLLFATAPINHRNIRSLDEKYKHSFNWSFYGAVWISTFNFFCEPI